MKNSAYRREYDALEEEFSLTAAMLQARLRSRLPENNAVRRRATGRRGKQTFNQNP